LKPALTPSGDLRKKPREYDHTFVMRSKAGNLLIMHRRGAKGKGALVALFILKKSVTIPARHYMSITRDAIAARAIEIMTRGIERGLAKQ
jgi:hypothetical protein